MHQPVPCPRPSLHVAGVVPAAGTALATANLGPTRGHGAREHPPLRSRAASASPPVTLRRVDDAQARPRESLSATQGTSRQARATCRSRRLAESLGMRRLHAVVGAVGLLSPRLLLRLPMHPSGIAPQQHRGALSLSLSLSSRSHSPSNPAKTAAAARERVSWRPDTPRATAADGAKRRRNASFGGPGLRRGSSETFVEAASF